MFAIDDTELGTTDVARHCIKTGDHPPIKQPPRRVPFSLRKTVDELVGNMLSQGVVVTSSSPWASPIVVVCKKDGGTRFCVDYRRLNKLPALTRHWTCWQEPSTSPPSTWLRDIGRCRWSHRRKRKRHS